MSRIVGWIIFNLLNFNKRYSLYWIPAHTITHHSLAGILTLSGDEVVGSMVALKQRRGMTCWVSDLHHRHSCMGVSLSLCFPLPSLVPYIPLCKAWFLSNSSLLSNLLTPPDRLFTLVDCADTWRTSAVSWKTADIPKISYLFSLSG